MDMEAKNFQENWAKKEQDIKEYNEKVTVLNPKYTAFKPYGLVIVRCYHIEPTYVGGLAVYPKIPMAERTQNGVGVRQTMDSPWALSRRAVVVAVPDGSPYMPGDIVELHRKCVLPEKMSVDHPAHLPYGFTLSEWYDFEPPSNPDNEHFGYLAVNAYNDILGKIDMGEIF